jgi:short-subunit dehydrogenase
MKVLDQFKLNGRVALVTGASRGLGQGMAVALGSAGASVALVARTKASLEETAKRIEKEGSKAYVLQADISKISEAQRVVRETVEHFGQLNILINSVGTQVRPAGSFGSGMNVREPEVTFYRPGRGQEMVKAKEDHQHHF